MNTASEIGGDISKFESVPKLVAFVATFKDPAIHKFYEHKIFEGKNHLNVMGHVCHKLISIIFAVLRDNKPYEPAQISS